MTALTMTEASDAALLERSREGERSAFGTLVERHQGAVCAITFSLTGDRALSEDLAQDAFLAAWRGLRGLRDPGRFRSWVCGIARNLGLTAIRSRTRRREVDAALPEPADAHDLEDAIDAQQSAELVWSSLERIPPRYREALVLYYREGRSAEEVAAALGISVSAAEQRLSRGRKHLANRVERLVAGSLERGRPKRGFAAGVVAALPSVDATTTTATKSATSRLPWLVAAAGLVVGAAVVLTSGHEPQPRTHAVAATIADEERESSAVSTAPDIDEVRRKRAQAQYDAPKPPAAPPFRLTKVSDGKYSVDLDGGFSRATLPPLPAGAERPPIPPVVRHVTGVVLTEQGEPLEGAVVVGGRRLIVSGGNVSTSAGDTTGPDGRFSLELRTDEPISMVALHRRGWSRLARIEGGSTEASVTLQLDEPSRGSGRIYRDGDPIESNVRLTIDDRGARLQAFTKSTDDGTWSLPPLPSGRWTVAAYLPGSPVNEAPSQQVAAGTRTVQDVDLRVGGTVEIIAPLDKVETTFIVVELFPGKHRVPDLSSLEDLKRRFRSDKQHLFRPTQPDEPVVMEDVPRGAFTACLETVTRPGFEVTSMGCATGNLEAEHAAVEVSDLEPVTTH